MSQQIIEHDYVVIGAGSGGLLVAVGIGKLGKDYAVVSGNIGGDCTHFGCVPSKTLLHFSKEYQTSCDLGEKEKIKYTTLQKVQKKVQSFIKEENNLIPEDRYHQGSAVFLNENTLEVSNGKNKKHLKFRKKCIIATGSRPRLIEIEGISQDKIITNEDFFYLSKLPKSITIIGGGPIGAEFATACASFDIETHLVSSSYLPKEPKEIGEKSLASLQALGVKYHKAKPLRLEKKKLYLDNETTIPETELYLSAVGRISNVNLNLEKAQVDYDNRGISVNKNLLTTNNDVFAIGDCTQNPQFTHLAAHQGKFVLKKIALPFVQKRERALPRVTFTSPSISSVGELEEERGIKLFELKFSNTDKARTKYDQESYGIVAIDISSGRIVGASLFGDFGEDLISVFTLIVDERIPVLKLTDFITPYPTFANIFHTLSVDYLSYLSSNWKSMPFSVIKQFISYVIN